MHKNYKQNIFNSIDYNNDGEAKRIKRAKYKKISEDFSECLCKKKLDNAFSVGKFKNSCLLYQNNSPIPGLFAAGEVAGHKMGTNRLGSTSMADIYTFGRAAGTNAADFAS